MLNLDNPKITEPTRVKFTVSDFYKMIEHGILRENPHEDIIDGVLWKMPQMSPRRAAHRSLINEKLFRRFDSEKFSISVSRPIVLDDYNELMPDVCFLKRRANSRNSSHPEPHEVFIVFIISDENLKFERDVKIPLYADAEIPEIWLFNLPEEKIEIYSQPNKKVYNSIKCFGRKDSVKSEILPEITFEVTEILI